MTLSQSSLQGWETGGERPSGEWIAWRCATQNVTRAWNEWLAADHCNGRDRYRRYLSALAEEELAAARIERALNCGSDPARNPPDPSRLASS